MVRVLLSPSFLPFFFFFKLKTAGVDLGSPKVCNFYPTKMNLPVILNQSTYGNWQVVLIPWMCLCASEMASYEKGSLIFETERCSFVTF